MAALCALKRRLLPLSPSISHSRHFEASKRKRLAVGHNRGPASSLLRKPSPSENKRHGRIRFPSGSKSSLGALRRAPWLPLMLWIYNNSRHFASSFFAFLFLLSCVFCLLTQTNQCMNRKLLISGLCYEICAQTCLKLLNLADTLATVLAKFFLFFRLAYWVLFCIRILPRQIQVVIFFKKLGKKIF